MSEPVVRITVHGRETGDPDTGPTPRIGVVGIITIFALAVLAYFFARPHERLLKLLLAIYIVVPVHLMGFVIVGRMSGVTILRISIYYGGAIYRKQFGQTWLCINWFPLGGYVKYDGMGANAPPPPPPGSWLSLHPLTRVAIALAGPALLILFAAILLGPVAAIREVSEFPAQCLQILHGQLPQLLRGFFHFVDLSDPLPIIGVVAAKMAAINLLPLPIVNGGQALTEIIQWIIRRPLGTRTQTILQMIGLFFILGSFLYWLVQIPAAWRAEGVVP